MLKLRSMMLKRDKTRACKSISRFSITFSSLQKKSVGGTVAWWGGGWGGGRGEGSRGGETKVRADDGSWGWEEGGRGRDGRQFSHSPTNPRTNLSVPSATDVQSQARLCMNSLPVPSATNVQSQARSRMVNLPVPSATDVQSQTRFCMNSLPVPSATDVQSQTRLCMVMQSNELARYRPFCFRWKPEPETGRSQRYHLTCSMVNVLGRSQRYHLTCSMVNVLGRSQRYHLTCSMVNVLACAVPLIPFC